MTPIRPARLMKNVDLESIPAGSPSNAARPAASRTLAGRALIFWDPQRSGEKLDAIDTDQLRILVDSAGEPLEEGGAPRLRVVNFWEIPILDCTVTSSKKSIGVRARYLKRWRSWS